MNRLRISSRWVANWPNWPMASFLPALLALVALLAVQCGPSLPNRIDLQSPTGQLTLQAQWQQGQVQLRLCTPTDSLLLIDRVGFRLRNAAALDSFQVLALHTDSLRETWELPWGEKKQVINHAQTLTLELKDLREGRLLTLEMRLFDDGLGLRYRFPEQAGAPQWLLLEELTRYQFPTDNTVWWSPWDANSYEKLFRKTTLAQVDSAGTPLTMHSPKAKRYLAFHEAALVNFAEMFLVPESPASLKTALSPMPDGTAVDLQLPAHSPWRTIVVSPTAGGLIESDLVLNLNEPNKLPTTDYIRPMTYIGVWWSLHLGVETWFEGERHGATTARALRYIDFAAANNIGGVLFEGWNTGWDKWGQARAFDQLTAAADFDLPRIAAYAKEKGVALIGHHETGGDVPYYEENLERAFALCDSLGIRAVKTGYAGTILPAGHSHSDQRMINHYQRVVETAARYRVALNVHEPVKPTGLRRTYPNLMTGEGVRGTEYNAWSDGNPPAHMLTLPFTRMLAGPLDYTPGIFDIKMQAFAAKRKPYVTPEQMTHQIQSTLAHQLALSVILYSPLQMAADMIENYEGHPAFAFYRSLKTSFDNSQVLHGEIGQYISIARRAGNEWFIGSATNEQARSIELSFDFLPLGQSFAATLYTDAPDAHYLHRPTAYQIAQQTVTADTRITLQLAPGGGAAIYLKAQ